MPGPISQDISEIVASNMKRLRLEHGFTIKKVGEEIGERANNLSAMENGKRKITNRIVQKLVVYYGTFPEEFFKLNGHSDMLENMLHNEISKMDNVGKAALLTKALEINSIP